MKNISGKILTELRWDDSFHVPEANAENTTLIEEVRPNGWGWILDVCVECLRVPEWVRVS